MVAAQSRRRSVQRLVFTLGLLLLGLGAATTNESVRLLANTTWRALGDRRRLSYGYEELAKLVASDAAASDNFGRSVAIDGNTIVVGSPWDNDGGTRSGSAYVLRTGDGGTTYA